MIQFDRDKTSGVMCETASCSAATAVVPASEAGAVHATHRAHDIVTPQELPMARQLRGSASSICEGVNLRNEADRGLEKDGHPGVAAVSDWITIMRISTILVIDVGQRMFVITHRLIRDIYHIRADATLPRQARWDGQA
jgi:hypothetical protein